MKKRVFRYVAACMVVLFLASCIKPAGKMFHGWYVQESTPLTTGQNEWRTFDIVLDYHAEQTSEILSFSGQLRMTQHYHLLYAQVRHLSVYLFLVDDHKSILKTVRLLNFINDSSEFTRSFDVKVDLPAGATALAFGYRGSAHELDSSTHFDLLPKAPSG